MAKKKDKALRQATDDAEKELKKTYLGDDYERSEADKQNKKGEEKIDIDEKNGNEEISEENDKDELSELKSENERLREKLLRQAAELENLRKRTVKEKNELLEYGAGELLAKLLPIIDDFEQAVAAGKTSKDFDALFQGVQMIYDKFLSTLAEFGLKKMDDPTGKPFDVDYHDALMRAPHDELPENSVVQVVQPGYMYKDRVLRHAKVVTSAGPNKE